VLCPVLVERSDEVDGLVRRFGDLQDARGGVVVLVGDAGVGKSRLAAEIAGQASELGLAQLSGRAVPSESPIPYRPLSEAFANAFRDTPMPRDGAGRGLSAHYGRFVPAWDSGAAIQAESPVVLGEVAVKLFRLAARQSGAVVLLEDLHWADPETLELLDYLADALSGEPILCVCTSRTSGAADGLVQRLRRRSAEAVIDLAGLTSDGVDRMVAECLDVAMPPVGLDEFVRIHSDGIPFVVEELLAGLVASGELRRVGSRWIVGELHARVPSSVRDSIGQRLAALTPQAQRVLGAAALLGRSFEWELLPGIAELDGPAVLSALRSAVEVQLIATDGRGFRFRHALSREAVLEHVLPPEQRMLATRAWPAVERAHPGLPGPMCELAAALAELAGEDATAAQRLVVSARRAAASGALTTAEATARRAVRLAAADSAASVLAETALLDVLVLAGNSADALELGQALLGRVDATDVEPRALAELHLAVARAAIAAGDLSTADDARTAAGEIAARIADARLSAAVDAIGAHVALDGGDLAAAEKLAQRALDGAAATSQPAVECDALMLLGRIVRGRNWDEAETRFERAASVAQEAGLPTTHLQAALELSGNVWVPGALARMQHTRDVAARYGAIAAAAVIDLWTADIALLEWDAARCLSAARDCLDASHRYRLATEPLANLWLAGAHALTGGGAQMQAAIDASLAAVPDDPRVLADLYGRVLVTRAIVEDRLDDVPALFGQMAEQIERAPDAPSLFAGRPVHALIQAVADERAAAAALLVLEHGADDVSIFVHAIELAKAIAQARAGDSDASTQVASARDALLSGALGAGIVHSSALFVAPVAAREGWGDAVSWLRGAEAWFGNLGHDRVARRCRVLLNEAGAPMPRRGRGDSDVPAGLRALGVTSREVDVLKLVLAGRTNRSIAEELVLSPKTIERHLASLFVRTGVANRRDLAALAAKHLGDPDR
jgi:DNA-binding CsgD family transcriptional regulator